MIKIVTLEPDIAVAAQLAEADFAEIAARGFRSVVNNRPDGEEPDQLPNARAEAAARRHDLVFRHQPVTVTDMTDDDAVDAFARLMSEMPGPILFYCRTGGRCTTLWTQASAGRLGVETVLTAARDAGCELDFLRDTLTERGTWPAPAVAESRAVPVTNGC